MKYRARAMSRPSAGMDIVTWAMEKADAIDKAAQKNSADETTNEPELKSVPDEGVEESALDDAKAV